MSHQPVVAPSRMSCEFQPNTQNNAKGSHADRRARGATRCTAELPPTKHSAERNMRRSVGAPGSSNSMDSSRQCPPQQSIGPQRSEQLPQLDLNPEHLTVAGWSLAFVRLAQVLLCSLCAWTTATSAMELDSLARQSQAAQLLHTLLLVFFALCCFAGVVDLLWLLLVLKPGWRRPATWCCGDKPYSCELTLDITNMGIWFALLLSILVQRMFEQWRGIIGTLLLAIFHGVSAGLVVWRRTQAGAAAAAAQQLAEPQPSQLAPQRLHTKPRRGTTPVTATAPAQVRASQYKVPNGN